MNFYKQNLERFDKILVKNLNRMIYKKQKEELNNIKGINKEDDKEYALQYLLLIFIRNYILLIIIKI